MATPTVAGLKPLFMIQGPGVGGKPDFDGPMSAAFGKNGRIYVADTGNNRIVVFNRNGRYIRQFGELGLAKPAPEEVFSWKPGRFNYPTDVATDDEGNVYVADFRNDQIQVFDPDGRFLRVFPDRDKQVGTGAAGQGGTGIAVTSLAVDGERVYATDAFQVVVFGREGEVLGQFGKPGSGPTDFDRPNGIAIGPDSTVAVSDSNHGRVLGMTPAGRLVWSAGSRLGAVAEDQSPGSFKVPRGLCRTEAGEYIVADALASKLVRLSSTGKFDRTFGQRGSAPGEFTSPTDVDCEGNRLVVAEKGAHRVQVVALDAGE
jgi:tripartite motif-containing protein 71